MKKEYDILYVNGCSFTVGHHLKDKFPWPTHPSIMACKEISNEILHFFFENKYISNYLIS